MSAITQPVVPWHPYNGTKYKTLEEKEEAIKLANKKAAERFKEKHRNYSKMYNAKTKLKEEMEKTQEEKDEQLLKAFRNAKYDAVGTLMFSIERIYEKQGTNLFLLRTEENKRILSESINDALSKLQIAYP